MRRTTAVIDARDAPVLVLARTQIEARGSLGDGQLVELIERTDIGLGASATRASLLRLERAGYLKFGASGWQIAASSSHHASMHVW